MFFLQETHTFAEFPVLSRTSEDFLVFLCPENISPPSCFLKSHFFLGNSIAEGNSSSAWIQLLFLMFSVQGSVRSLKSLPSSHTRCFYCRSLIHFLFSRRMTERKKRRWKVEISQNSSKQIRIPRLEAWKRVHKWSSSGLREVKKVIIMKEKVCNNQSDMWNYHYSTPSNNTAGRTTWFRYFLSIAVPME